ncbi:MAG TPA: hypothetical protein VEG39_09195 [Clostridia bacterium]|nr:hypothetical protein [Clostridia bacterium]
MDYELHIAADTIRDLLNNRHDILKSNIDYDTAIRLCERKLTDYLKVCVGTRNFNGFATVYSSFHYIYFSGKNEPKDPPIDREKLFGMIKDEKLIGYLLLVVDGIRLYCEGTYEAAIEKLTGASRLCPGFDISHYFMVCCKVEKGRAEGKSVDELQLDIVDDLSNLDKDILGYLIKTDSRVRSVILPIIECFTATTWIKTILDYRKKYREENQLKSRLLEQNKILTQKYGELWSHLLEPDTLLGVSNKLSGDERLKDYAMKLIVSANNEFIIKNQSLLLLLRYMSNDPSSIRKSFKSGIERPGTDACRDITYYINYSLERVVYKILMHDGSREKFIKMNLEKNGYDTGVLKKKFEDEILFNYVDDDMIDWFNKNLYDIELEVQDAWKDFSIRFDSGAAATILEIFTEIFRNAITYGNKDKSNSIKIVLAKRTLYNNDYLLIKVSNPVDHDFTYTGSSGAGLKSMIELIRLINHNRSKHIYEYMESVEKEGIYTVSIMLDRMLFI